jgi:2-polyprenyl-6-methoxyphenol hydroxylase-like FAD-dependent oxidoreductase
VRIVCVGGGPAGLFFAIAAKLTDPGHEIEVFERDPAGSTYGWGVTFGDDLLDLMHFRDPVSARAVEASCVLWRGREVWLPEGPRGWLRGYGHSLMRSRLLEILHERAVDLGVRVHHEHPVDSAADLDADLVVAADGVRSRLRQAAAEKFRARVITGENTYIWLGTDFLFPALTLGMAQTAAGPIWFQAYPSTPELSTCVIECSTQTWQGLGLDNAGEADTLRILEQAFAAALQGARLIGRTRGQAAPWLRFDHVTNDVWYADNVVLLGDAAHTTHFSLASGTRLALHDGLVLARALSKHATLPEALAAYDARRRPALARIQRRALESMRWWEHPPFRPGMDGATFGYAITRRQGGTPPRWRVLLRQSGPVRAVQQRLDERERRWSAKQRTRPPRSGPGGADRLPE